MSQPTKAPTPETDKVFDMVGERESPGYNMAGHMPSKWSYEAILDLTDWARTLENQRDALKAAASDCVPCRHEWYQGACAHCELPAAEYRASKKNASGLQAGQPD